MIGKYSYNEIAHPVPEISKIAGYFLVRPRIPHSNPLASNSAVSVLFLLCMRKIMLTPIIHKSFKFVQFVIINVIFIIITFIL